MRTQTLDEELEEMVEGMEKIIARWESRIVPHSVPLCVDERREQRRLHKLIIIMRLGVRFLNHIHGDKEDT